MVRPNSSIDRNRDSKYYQKWANTRKAKGHEKYSRLLINDQRLLIEKRRIGWNYERKKNILEIERKWKNSSRKS